MKALFAACCLSGALAFATGVAAQDPSAANPGAKKDEKSQKQTMKVTGCLREATATPGEYELTNVTGGKASTYRLVAGSSVSLKEHVGHKVEITGQTAGGSDASSPEKSPTTAASGPEKIDVTSLKHIAASCEAGTK
jgi:hypothetical protein